MGKARVKNVMVKPKTEPDDEGSIIVSVPAANNVDPHTAADDVADAASASASRIKEEHKEEYKDVAPETNYLDQLVSKTSADELDAGVSLAVQLLDSLKTALSNVLAVTNTTKARAWLDAIQQLQDTAKPSRTVVGVVYVFASNGNNHLQRGPKKLADRLLGVATREQARAQSSTRCLTKRSKPPSQPQFSVHDTSLPLPFLPVD